MPDESGGSIAAPGTPAQSDFDAPNLASCDRGIQLDSVDHNEQSSVMRALLAGSYLKGSPTGLGQLIGVRVRLLDRVE